jgi:hypothetical protein
MLCGILWAFTFFVPPSKVLQVRILEREKEVLVGLATRLKKKKKNLVQGKKKSKGQVAQFLFYYYYYYFSFFP